MYMWVSVCICGCLYVCTLYNVITICWKSEVIWAPRYIITTRHLFWPDKREVVAMFGYVRLCSVGFGLTRSRFVRFGTIRLCSLLRRDEQIACIWNCSGSYFTINKSTNIMVIYTYCPQEKNKSLEIHKAYYFLHYAIFIYYSTCAVYHVILE